MLGFEVFPNTVDGYHERLAATLADPGTVVFLDTNVLAYPYRLFAQARDELLSWLSSLEDRLVVPAWAASEYFERLRSQKLKDYSPPLNLVRDAASALERAIDLAGLFIEGDWKGLGAGQTREAFITAFRTEAEPVLQKLERLGNGESRNQSLIHDDVRTRLLPRVARGSRLPELCARADSTGPARYEHRVPPGYQDRAKKENKNGDLILWFEILEIARSLDTAGAFVLVTNDEKTDWSYCPPRRRRTTMTRVDSVEPNRKPELRLTDPRLCLEFERYVRDGASFEVVSIPHVVAAQSRVNPGGFRHLAAALQLEARGSDRVDGAVDEPRPEPPPTPGDLVDAGPEVSETSPVGPVAEGAEPPTADSSEIGEMTPRYSNFALRDYLYPASSSSPVDSIVRSLRECNWYVQNPAVGKVALLAEVGGLTSDSLFVLGRNLYQAACGNAFEAVAFLEQCERRLRSFDPGFANDIVAGVAFELYFDKNADLRRQLKADRIDDVFRIVQDESYEPAANFIRGQLAEHRGRIIVTPSDTQVFKVLAVAVPVVTAWTDSEVWELTSIAIEGCEVLVPGRSARAGTPLKEAEIVLALAQEYGIPPRQVTLSVEPQDEQRSRVWWPEEKTLVETLDIRTR